jgi:hypothetical protein
MHRIDQHQPGDLVGMGTGIQLGEQPAVGMPGQHIRSRDAGYPQQGVQLGDEVTGGTRSGRGVAAAPGPVGVVVAAHPGEGRQLVLQLEPVGAQPLLEDHRGAAVAGAAQNSRRPANVEPARRTALGHDRRWELPRLKDLDQRWAGGGDADRDR